MDEETENWPIAMKHKDEFDLVKLNHEASPLRLYRGNSLVSRQIVLRRPPLLSARQKFDTFCADIQQIKILKPGTSNACSGFKRRNAREGPFDIVKAASSSAHVKGDELGRAEKRSKQVESKGTSSVP
ncbi:hypothetical protein K503DRAFT_776002 [Rhizopogon vinicolor AM-OR11-026]|uniref:Uncharacterized protein n=1 Tax=Rhizopogon vinicolor AM-OR11-026 TaxID=1314800 RepID=A0A1B7MKC8_9AGAM|nr:hypothetical protein K503DRAFT_776002 [Rhizopogon vinicolor AM-OR11-026]